MLTALLSLLSVYIGAIIGIIVTTVILILFGFGWGPLPHLYIRLIAFLQSFYPHSYPRAEATWPAIIRRSDNSALEKHRNDSLSSFKFSSVPIKNVFDVCSNALKAGFEAIVQDEISVAFEASPPFYTTLLEWPGRLPFPDAPRRILKRHLLGYLMCILFRYAVLLPIRLSLCLTSFIYCTIAVIVAFFVSLTKQQKIRISVTYCRLFCAGIGLVARYHNRQCRPKQPGIAVSNHLSPNDIQIIFSDVNTEMDYGYTVTGQKHSGIIWAIESLVEKLCPAIWLDRASPEDRERFMEEVLREGRREGPVLLFPEGYCTNNTRILRFRRAVFEEGITIYPIAIRQNLNYTFIYVRLPNYVDPASLTRQTARFGDSFWGEDGFLEYLLRIFASWAIVYDVYYLEPMKRQKEESAQAFATRVQREIAKYANAESIDFDGRLWYKAAERERMKDIQLENLADRINEIEKVAQTKEYFLKNKPAVATQKKTERPLGVLQGPD